MTIFILYSIFPRQIEPCRLALGTVNSPILFWFLTSYLSLLLLLWHSSGHIQRIRWRIKLLASQGLLFPLPLSITFLSSRSQISSTEWTFFMSQTFTFEPKKWAREMKRGNKFFVKKKLQRNTSVRVWVTQCYIILLIPANYRGLRGC
jgi:hypothetical protein